jgi:hypothetical protein
MIANTEIAMSNDLDNLRLILIENHQVVVKERVVLFGAEIELKLIFSGSQECKAYNTNTQIPVAIAGKGLDLLRKRTLHCVRETC